jgi:hypothetical protein
MADSSIKGMGGNSMSKKQASIIAELSAAQLALVSGGAKAEAKAEAVDYSDFSHAGNSGLLNDRSFYAQSEWWSRPSFWWDSGSFTDSDPRDAWGYTPAKPPQRPKGPFDKRRR